MSYITTRDNVKLYYKDWGKGRPDRRGFGRSQQTWDGYIEYDGAPHGLLASHKTRLIEDVLRFVR